MSPAPLMTIRGRCVSSARILSSREEIRQFARTAARLASESQNPLAHPEFFLASVADHWTPHVVCVQNECETLGMIYAKERKIGGLPTGLIYADWSLAGNLAEPSLAHEVLVTALKTLL